MTSTATTAKCTRCGRVLRSAQSIARGYGRHCQTKIRAAAQASTAKPAQVAKAQELIADGGLVLIRHTKTPVFLVVSSSGTDRYRTAPQACTCKAGLRGQHVCYHRLAAQLLTAA